MGVAEAEVEVEGEEAQEEEVEEAGVEVAEELVKTMQIIQTPKGNLPVETRNPHLRQSSTNSRV